MKEQDLIAKIKAATKSTNKVYHKTLTVKGTCGFNHKPRKRKIKRVHNDC